MTSYSDHEYTTLENKLKYANKTVRELEREISNLKIVKNNMDGAVGRFREHKNTKKKRVHVIKYDFISISSN